MSISVFYVVTCVERRSVSPLILFDNLRVSHLAGNLLRVWAGGPAGARLTGSFNVINELIGSGIR